MDLQRFRQDLDAVIKLTADLSRRLDELEARYEASAPSIAARELAAPPPLASVQVLREEETGRRGEEGEDLERKTGTLRDAAKQGDVALAKLRIEEGADVNEIVGYDSVLDLAVEAGHFEMVRLLVAHGAKIEHGFVGKSQIRRARALEHYDIANFLQREIAARSVSTRADAVTAPASTPLSGQVDAERNVRELVGDIRSQTHALWAPLTAGPIGQYAHERIEGIRSRTRELGWEVQLGTYWLPRVAVLCIAIAVVFFLTLAIERWGAAWMPHLRVGIGYAVCAGLLVLAWRSEVKYGGLARVAYGGGFAVMYFVTFATHYVPFARVFASPVPTLLLLTVVVVAWTIAAQVRQSKIIAVLVTGLGHLTVLLSTLTLNSPGSFPMMGLVALSAGSAFFLLRNRWYYVASLGLLGSYLNDFVALAHGHAGNPYMDFAGSMGVLVVFFLMFALAELFSPEELRRKSVPGWFRNAFVTFNTAACFALGSTVMSHFEFTRHRQDVFFFVFAAVLMLLGLAYLRVRARDPLFNVYLVKAVSLATLALATRYGGSALSACLAVEMVVLLISGRRSGLVVMRLLAFGVAGVAFFQSLDGGFQLASGTSLWRLMEGAALHLAPMGYMTPHYLTHVVRAGFSVLAFLVASQLYQRTDWAIRSPKLVPLPPDTLALCWQLDLVAEPPVTFKDTRKVFEGLLFPYVYALASAVLFLAYTFPLVQAGHRFAVVAGFALAMTATAALLHSKPFGLAAVGALILATTFIGNSELLHLKAIDLPVVIAGLVAAGGVALASEESRVGKRIGLAFHQNLISPYILYGACAWLTGLLLVKEFQGVNGAFALAAAAVVAAGLFLILHPTAFGLISGGFMLWASVVFLPGVLAHYHDDEVRFGVAAGLLVVLSLLGDRYFSFLRKRIAVAPYLSAGLVVNAIIVLLCHFEVAIRQEWLMTASALAFYGLFAYAVAFRSPAAVCASVAGVLYACWRHTLDSFEATSLQPSLILAFVLLAVFWFVSERLYIWLLSRYAEVLDWVKLKNGPDLMRTENALAPIALATLLLIVFLNRIPHLTHANLAFITISWFALAAGLFVVSLAFRQRFYRFAGLAVIVLSLGRLFLIDMKEQDALLRVAAFAVVGAGLLCISVGYYKWMARTRLGKQDNAGVGTTAAPNDTQ